MRRHLPAMTLLLVLLLLVAAGVALSRSSGPRVNRAGQLVVPVAWSRPLAATPAPAWSMPPPLAPGPAQALAPSSPSPLTAPAAVPPTRPGPAAAPARGGPPRSGSAAVAFWQLAPTIRAGMPPPHGPRGDCGSCHQVVGGGPGAQTPNDNAAPNSVAAAGGCTQPRALVGVAAPQPATGALPFQEAHWQGIEAISLTPGLARVMRIPADARGVVIDEVTYPADTQGFAGGDLITAVGGQPTPDLESLIAAADRVRDESRTTIEVLRDGQPRRIELTARRLGNAVGETAPMIPPGAPPPHGYMGPCTRCHRIGTGNNLPVDLGDVLSKAAPPIRAGQPRPHLDRGSCTACHQIAP